MDSHDEAHEQPVRLKPTPLLTINISAAPRDEAGDVNHVTFSRDGSVLATASGDYFCDEQDMAARLWDAATGALLASIIDEGAQVDAVALSADGALLAYVSGNELSIWAAMSQPHTATAAGRWSAAPQQRLLLSRQRDGEPLPAWPSDVPGVPTTTTWFHRPLFSSVAWSPDDTLLVTTGTDGAAHCWTADGQYLRALEGHRGTVVAAAWHPGGALLATASADRTARVWEVASGNCVHVLEGHGAPLTSIAWSADAQTIASAGQDAARLWRAADGAPLAALDAQSDGMSQVACSPDSRLLATSGHRDGTVRIWDVARGRCRAVLEVGAYVKTIAWRPDGGALAGGGSHGRVWLWPVSHFALG